MEDIIQFKVTLQWTKPPIWRRLLVPKDTTFQDFHTILQIAFDWHNSHLFEFNAGGERIGMKDDGFFMMDDMGDVIDANTITLAAVFNAPKQKISYEYDFGDGWVHNIVAEKFLPREVRTQYPSCTAGKLKAPPEDCGGVPGFYDLLEILADKKHPEHEDMVEWLEEDYDPKHFEIDEINHSLQAWGKHSGKQKR